MRRRLCRGTIDRRVPRSADLQARLDLIRTVTATHSQAEAEVQVIPDPPYFPKVYTAEITDFCVACSAIDARAEGLRYFWWKSPVER